MSNTRPACPITFVNSVGVTGFGNGVVNVALMAMSFVPVEAPDGSVIVAADAHVAVNLRMDLFCAQQLRDELDKQIKAAAIADKPSGAEVN